MQLVAESTSLIIRGNWNPAILQPAWLVTNVLEKNPENVPVAMEFAAIAGVPPRYTIDEIRFAPTFESVSIIPTGTDDESLKRLEDVARNLLRCLPHTPVSAFGQNFEFLDSPASEAATALFSIRDRLAEKLSVDVDTNSTELISSLQIEDHVLNLKRTLDREGNLRLGMNFHYVTVSADNAVELLEDSFTNNLAIAQEISEIYDGLRN